MRVDEVELEWSSLNSGDVFVLDLGLHIIQVASYMRALSININMIINHYHMYI